MGDDDKLLTDPQASDPSGDPQDPGAPAPGDQPDPGQPAAQPGDTTDPQKPVETDKDTVSIDRYTRATNRAAYLERENLNLRKEHQERVDREAAAARPAAASPASEEKPLPGNYETDAEYFEAVADWKYEQRAAERKATQAAETAKATEEAQVDKMRDIVDKQLVSDPAYLEKAFMPESLISMTLDSDQFVKMSLHFGNDRNEAIRIAMLPPIEAAREIGRLETTLKNSTPPQRSASGAPTPTETVGGREGAISSDPDSMSMPEYRKWRAEGGGKD